MNKIRNLLLRDRPSLALILLTLSALLCFYEHSSGNLGFGLHYGLAALLVTWYLYMLLRDHQPAILTSFYQVFYGIGMLVSAAIISSGGRMIEISETGTANGAFWLMVFFFVAGLEATVLGFRLGRTVKLPLPAVALPRILDGVIMSIMILPVLLLSLYVFIATGGPLLLGMNRVTFWQTTAPPGTSILRSVVPQTFFFVAFIYLNQVRKSIPAHLGKLLIAAYVIIGLAILGEKFSLFIILISVWLIVFTGTGNEIRVNSIKTMSIAAATGILLLALVWVNYAMDGKNLDFIVTRIALQAQLLWSASNSLSLYDFSEVRFDCYFGCGPFINGMDYISNMYLPSGTYEFYKKTGTILSGYMPSLSMVTFGLGLTLFFHITICILLGILQSKLVAALSKGQPIYGFLLFKLQLTLTLTWFAAMQTGGPGVIAVLISILFYRLFAGYFSEGRLGRILTKA